MPSVRWLWRDLRGVGRSSEGRVNEVDSARGWLRDVGYEKLGTVMCFGVAADGETRGSRVWSNGASSFPDRSDTSIIYKTKTHRIFFVVVECVAVSPPVDRRLV